jgi:hypothetical protein
MQHLYYLICIVLLYDTMRRRLGNLMANAFTLELIEYTELWKWSNIECNYPSYDRLSFLTNCLTT